MRFYTLEIYDNDSYLLDVGKEDRYKYVTCNTCHMILNKRNLIESYLSRYKIKRKKYHLSCSYDGFITVSQQFKELYDISHWDGLIFYPIPKSKGFYIIECVKTININQTERPIEFDNRCNECNQHIGIYGSVPLYINSSEIQKMQSAIFFRSDMEFAHDFEQCYELIASEEITSILKAYGLVTNKDLREIRVI